MVQTYSDTERDLQSGRHQNGSGMQPAESYARALEAVQHLPLPMLTSLLHEIANQIGQQTNSTMMPEAVTSLSSLDDPKHNSVELLLGGMKTNQPPPPMKRSQNGSTNIAWRSRADENPA